MKTLDIKETDAGQRLDKFLVRVLPGAGKSFLYKMLRKKNITLNGKKAEGNETVLEGDRVEVFFSDETFEKFCNSTRIVEENNDKNKIVRHEWNHEIPAPSVVFENEHVLILDKPAGLLSQKAKPDDISVVEFVEDYVKEKEPGFKPSVSNRLDRNTSGLILAGKTIFGQRVLSEMLKERSLSKYYLCIVKGDVKAGRAESYLEKNEVTNTVKIGDRGEKIVTVYKPLAKTEDSTLLEVDLVTGKSHQIRAQMAALCHPLAGDAKYGDKAYNQVMKKKYGITHQALHAYRVVFPKDCRIKDLAGKTVKTKLPKEIGEFCGLNGIDI